MDNRLSAISPERPMSLFLYMFSSHPETQKRIKHMQKRCEEDGIVRPAA